MNPHHFGRRSPKNLYSFSGCRSFRFSGSSRYPLLAYLPGPLIDPKAPCAAFLQALPRSLTAYNDAHLRMNKEGYINYYKLQGMRIRSLPQVATFRFSVAGSGLLSTCAHAA